MLKTIEFFLIACLILVFSSCSGKKEPRTEKHTYFIVDDLNNRIYFDSVPQRVISLAPNLTEMVFAMGEGKKLVGNTLYCVYPEEAKKVAKVGDLITTDFERVMALKPDLILITMEGNTKDNYEKLKNLGFKIFISNPRDFTGIKKTFLDLGKIFKSSDKTENMVNDWNARYNSIVQESRKYPQLKAMFLVSLNPLMLAGKNTFINELMASAGLYNIASVSSTNYPVFNREELLKYNPDYIILEERFVKDINNMVKLYPEWKSINAVKNNNILFIDSYLYLTPGPRFIAALEDLFSRIHPQAK
jgi:iron complex transport system substrate-binding protein